MAQTPKKKKKLPKDVRELDNETVVDKLFGKRGAKELRKAVHEKDLKDSGKR